MNTAADLVERSVHETLTYYAFPDIHWQEDPHQQSTRADHERDSAAHPRRRRIPRWPIMSQSCGSSTALHRWHRMVRQMLHEYETTLSAASPANRSRGLIKCAKESARFPGRDEPSHS